jgi:predicted MFS family arabinose efflux permease
VSLNRPVLTVLGASTFFYVTAETIPVGLLPQIAEGLEVDEASVGLLLTSYAVVAAVSTIPLTALTMRVPRHLLIAVTVAVFVVSQAAATFAPTFTILVVTRLICALAHGVFWSVIAPVTARLAPPGQAGRATGLVFVGNSLAIVLGVPLGTALGQWLGWRVALGVMALGGLVSLLALLRFLPKLPPLPQDLETSVGTRLRTAFGIIRNRRVALLCLITVTVVLGHFATYTYLAPLLRRDAGLTGFGLSALLLGYGAAGLIANYVAARYVDRRPGTLLTLLLVVLAGSVALLAPVLGLWPAVLATLLWGAAFTAIPLCLAAATLRVVPRSRDAVNAAHVVAFQIGIGGGSLVGERLVSAGHLPALPVFTVLLAVISCVVVVLARDVFPARMSTDDHHRLEAELADVRP